MDEKKILESALYFLIKDAVEYARLKTFGGYLDEHGMLESVSLKDLPDHLDIAKNKLARSALGYFHATTLGKGVERVTIVVEQGDGDGH